MAWAMLEPACLLTSRPGNETCPPMLCWHTRNAGDNVYCLHPSLSRVVVQGRIHGVHRMCSEPSIRLVFTCIRIVVERVLIRTEPRLIEWMR